MTGFNYSFGSFRKATDEIVADMDRAASATMDDVTLGAKSDLRDQVIGSGMGRKLANTWQGRRYPRGRDSADAAAYIWSKAPKLIDAFDRGAVIRSQDGFYLAIPTPAAGARGLGLSGKREKITPGGWERRTGLRLRFVYRRGRPSLLVADDTQLGKSGVARTAIRRRAGADFVRIAGRQTVVMFILVPQVKEPKLLDIDRVANAWANRVGDLLLQHWQ